MTSATKQPTSTGENTAGVRVRHDWKFMKLVGCACCTACGIIRNDHNENALCPGHVKVGLRSHGHATLADGSHVALTEQEAAAIWESIDRATAERAAKYPDERSAINGMMDAYTRLKELGWREAVYCPKDGSTFDAIEMGSTGIHKCYYEGKWPDGHWWIPDECDVWPSRPCLYRSPTALPDSDQ